MLMSIGVADAYAIPWEFVKNPKDHGLVNDLQTYQQHPKYGPAGELVPSQYTDDTLRSIATALVVINNKNSTAFDPTAYVRTIQLVVQSDRRKGWSRRFQSYLEANLNADPVDFLRGISKRADTNGALMGCLPVAYLKTPVDVRLAVAAQAMATHSSRTVPFAQSMALAAHYFLNGGKRDGLVDYLAEESEGPSTGDLPKTGGVDMSAAGTCSAVLALLGCGPYAPEHESLSGLLRAAVDLGGDTDSVAALVVGIASCSTEFTHDLPVKLVDELDLGRGKHYLRSLDKKLHGVRV
jgi:ADP-ribosyl-[dinitrogen reductase] hydrolase